MGRLMAAVIAAGSGLLISLAAMSPPAAAAASHTVTTAADSGPGSLRAALAAAEADGDDSVITLAEGLDPIALATGLSYVPAEAPSYSLTIRGGGGVVTDAASWSAGTAPLLQIRGPSRVVLRDITFTGSPGPGVVLAAGGEPVDLLADRVSVTASGGDGLAVIQDDAEADVAVTLRDSTFSGNGGDGVHVAQSRGADLDVTVEDTVANANAGAGISVRASGAGGDLVASIAYVDAAGNGASGVLVDRTGPACCPVGVLDVSVSHVVTEQNGDDGVAVTATGPLDDVAVAFDSVTSRLNGDADDDADGAAVAVDTEGADVDVRFTNSAFIANTDDGVEIDMTENADVDVTVDTSWFDRNNEDGLNLDTDVSNGDYDVEVSSSSFSGNGVTDPMGDGLDASNLSEVALAVSDSRFRRNADEGLDVFACCGPLSATISGSVLSDNGGDGTHLVVDTDAPLSARLVRTQVDDNAGESSAGIRIDGAGTVSAFVLRASVTGNAGAGVALGGAGSGLAFVVFSDLVGNGAKWSTGPGLFVLPIGS